jgi:hypothetical protein
MRAQPGVDVLSLFTALKELNILVMGKTFHPERFHTPKEVFYTPPQMMFFYDVPVDSLYNQLICLNHNKSR